MKIKDFNNLMIAMLYIIAFAATLTYFSTISFTGSLILFSVALIIYTVIPKQKGVAQMAIFREIWTGEVIKFVTAALKATFLDGIADYSKYVSNVGDEAQAIHINSMNVLPEVLINNTTYPLGIADQLI
ncbi:hypothetical protein [Pedobacter sp. NJ-S-72]